MKKIKCCVCKREKKLKEEGRFIDGEWVDDDLIQKRYWGKWVCSYSCYNKMVRKKIKGKLT